VKTFCYTSKRVVRANHNEPIVKLSEVYLILISEKYEVYITPEVKNYAIPVV